MAASHITIIMAEDHVSLRQAYIRYIEDDERFKVIGEVGNGEELLNLLLIATPHIIILDLEMPVMSGFDVLPLLKQNYPHIKVVILSTHKNVYLMQRLLKSGAHSYLPKNCSMDDIITTLTKVDEEGYFFDESISRLIVSNYIKEVNDASDGAIILSDREVDVLSLFCEGKSYKTISDELFVSLNTVKYHLKNIFKKTEFHSVPELVKYAIKIGVTELN